jgi:hypothetical protein
MALRFSDHIVSGINNGWFVERGIGLVQRLITNITATQSQYYNQAEGWSDFDLWDRIPVSEQC